MSDQVPDTDNDVIARIDALHDLFRRRLLDDRDKRAMLQTLAERLELAERRRDSEHLRPLTHHLALVVDRADSAGEDNPLAQSLADEICDALAAYGVVQVPATGPVLAGQHEVLDAGGAAPAEALHIVRLVRRGFVKDGVVLRPALVIAEPDRSS